MVTSLVRTAHLPSKGKTVFAMPIAVEYSHECDSNAVHTFSLSNVLN